MSQPLLIIAVIVGSLVAFAVVGYLLLLRQRARLLTWVRGLFRRPPEPGSPPGPRHYYKPYWS